MMRLVIGLPVLVGWLMVGCLTPDVTVNAPLDLEITPVLSAEEQLREAFGQADASVRRTAVLEGVPAFLDQPAVRALDDPAVSLHLTNIAFSSGRMTFSDPAFVSRRENLAVVGLPDGMGLFVFDLSQGQEAQSVEISQWTAGLSAVDVVWGSSELGVSFSTVGGDQRSRAHFVLMRQEGVSWRAAWQSDEDPDWWINAYDASIAAAPDLSSLTVEGGRIDSTQVFDERASSLRRIFKTVWARQGDTYIVVSSPQESSDRMAWFWTAAQPSPYATLVEFIERLRRQDIQAASQLVDNPEVVSDAVAFGLYLADAPYQITAYDTERIVFQGHQGAFVVEFQPPLTDGGRWLIASLRPVGAGPVTGILLE